MLNPIETAALKWFHFRTDSTKFDSLIKFSAIPFNCNNDTVIYTQDGLQDWLKKVIVKIPVIIDTVFIANDSLKKFFPKYSNIKRRIIEIWFFSTNSLRTNTILLEVQVKKIKVVGYFFLGDFRYRREYGITGY
jgi:hypothetical protein